MFIRLLEGCAHDSRCRDGTSARFKVQMYGDLHAHQYAVVASWKVRLYPSRSQVVDPQDRTDDSLGGIVVDQNTCLHESLSTDILWSRHKAVATYAMRCLDSRSRWSRLAQSRHRRER